MAHQIDLSDFDPYSPTATATGGSHSSALFGSSSNSDSHSVPSSTSTGNHVSVSTTAADDDPLSLFGQLELGGARAPAARNGNSPNAPVSSSAFSAVRAQNERQSRILSDLAREPFHPPPLGSIIDSAHDANSPTSTRHPRPFSPPRRLSSLMDLGDHQYNQFPHQFSPPMSSSPTLEPFHPVPSTEHAGSSSSASRRMRQASEDYWTSTKADPGGAAGTTSARRRTTRERSTSAEWGDFQTATPPTPTATTDDPPFFVEHERGGVPGPRTTTTTTTTKPAPRRASTTPIATSPPRTIPTLAPSLSSHHLKNLPAPPSAPNSLFDPFNQPVKLASGGTSPPILTETIAEGLRPSLPPRLRISTTWRLLYSLDQHGTSLLTLLHRVAAGLRSSSGGGFVLVVKTDRGRVFGGYVSEEFKSDGSVLDIAGTGGAGKRTGLSSLLTGNKVWGGDGSSSVFSSGILKDPSCEGSGEIREHRERRKQY